MHTYLRKSNLKTCFESQESVEEEKEVQEDAKPIALLDILDYQSEKPKRILIEGEPGIGKSTLTRKLCQSFSEGQFAKEYKLIVPIDLQNASQETTKEQNRKNRIKLLISALSFSFDISDDDLDNLSKMIDSTSGEGFLFIFDACEKFKKGSFLAQILECKALTKASFIVTSRPNTAKSFSRYYNRSLQVVGFTTEERDAFIQKCHIKEIPAPFCSIFESFGHNPLLLSMLCRITEEGTAGPPPKTVTQLIGYTVGRARNLHLKNVGKGTEEHNFQENCKLLGENQFKYLCSLALKMAEPDAAPVFNPDEGEHFGLLKKGKSAETRDGHDCRPARFLHEILQDFFTALGLRCLSVEEQVEFWREKITVGSGSKGMVLRQVFQFFCGLGGLKENEKLQEEIREQFQPEAKNYRFFLYSPLMGIAVSLAESRDEELCQKMIFENKDVEIVISTQNPIHLEALKFLMCLEKCRNNIKSFTILFLASSTALTKFLKSISNQVKCLNTIVVNLAGMFIIMHTCKIMHVHTFVGYV